MLYKMSFGPLLFFTWRFLILIYGWSVPFGDICVSTGTECVLYKFKLLLISPANGNLSSWVQAAVRVLPLSIVSAAAA